MSAASSHPNSAHSPEPCTTASLAPPHTWSRVDWPLGTPLTPAAEERLTTPVTMVYLPPDNYYSYSVEIINSITSLA